MKTGALSTLSISLKTTIKSAVGYGDLYPTTDASRLFTALYILMGVTVVLASLAIIGTKYLEIREAHFKKRWKK